MTDKDTFTLSRRKILGGIATVGVASAGAGAGTFALFSDSEKSTGNNVSAGTLDLADPSDSTFSVAAGQLAPGETTQGTITLKNDGSLDGDHLEVGTSYTENDGYQQTDAPESDGGEVGVDAFARELHIDRLAYPNDATGAFLAATQVPGAYVYDINGDGSKPIDISRTNSPPGTGAPSTAIHVNATTSDGTSADYARSLVDVSGQNFSVSDLDNGSFSYDYYAVDSENGVNLPDEAKLLVRDGNGNAHFLFRHVGSDSTEGTGGDWDTRNVDLTATWYEVDLGDGSRSSVTPATEFATATVELVGIGAGNTNPDSAPKIDCYFGNLTLGDGSTTVKPNFRETTASAYDLSQVRLDNLAGLSANGGSNDFQVRFRLNENVGNDFQGDGATVKFQFTLNQQASQ